MNERTTSAKSSKGTWCLLRRPSDSTRSTSSNSCWSDASGRRKGASHVAGTALSAPRPAMASRHCFVVTEDPRSNARATPFGVKRRANSKTNCAPKHGAYAPRRCGDMPMTSKSNRTRRWVASSSGASVSTESPRDDRSGESGSCDESSSCNRCKSSRVFRPADPAPPPPNRRACHVATKSASGSSGDAWPRVAFASAFALASRIWYIRESAPDVERLMAWTFPVRGSTGFHEAACSNGESPAVDETTGAGATAFFTGSSRPNVEDRRALFRAALTARPRPPLSSFSRKTNSFRLRFRPASCSKNASTCGRLSVFGRVLRVPSRLMRATLDCVRRPLDARSNLRSGRRTASSSRPQRDASTLRKEQFSRARPRASARQPAPSMRLPATRKFFILARASAAHAATAFVEAGSKPLSPTSSVFRPVAFNPPEAQASSKAVMRFAAPSDRRRLASFASPRSTIF